jgi:glyoxylase-like metal-dependent hydrolase (beta-lactamase superfamily II)
MSSLRKGLPLFVLGFATVTAGAQTVGEVLPPWTRGTLDIHQINTGRGNSALLIFPDGTSMLIDAGEGGRLPPRGTAPKPDSSRTPGEWIACYARHMLAHDPAPAIDYGYLTHFHDDQMGEPGPTTPIPRH